MFSFRNKL